MFRSKKSYVNLYFNSKFASAPASEILGLHFFLKKIFPIFFFSNTKDNLYKSNGIFFGC